MQRKIMFVFLLFALFVSATYAITVYDVNASTLPSQGRIAKTLIERANKEMQRMRIANLPTRRVRDLLSLAENAFIKAYEANSQNYSLATEKAREAIKVVKLAFRAKDEISLLEKHIEENKANAADLSKAYDALEKAKKELKDERYEIALKYVDEGYTAVAEAVSLQAKAQTLYSLATRNIVTFVYENRYAIIAAIIILIIIIVFFGSQISAFRLAKKLNYLEMEIKTLEDLIKKAQTEYFKEGSVSETIYKTRTATFRRKLREVYKEAALVSKELESKKIGKLLTLGKSLKRKTT